MCLPDARTLNTLPRRSRTNQIYLDILYHRVMISRNWQRYIDFEEKSQFFHVIFTFVDANLGILGLGTIFQGLTIIGILCIIIINTLFI